MHRAFRTILPIAFAMALGLLVLSWSVQAWLGRALTVGEWFAAGVAVVALVSFWIQARRQRDRRRIQDMRDSALW